MSSYVGTLLYLGCFLSDKRQKEIIADVGKVAERLAMEEQGFFKSEGASESPGRLVTTQIVAACP